MNKTLNTKFGTAKIDYRHGYYRITSWKEGNNGKYLHRLIWEDFYNTEIPKGYVIHHRDHNPLNNCIMNLQLMRDKDHRSLHSTGENHPLYGKHHTDNAKRKISESRKGISCSDETMMKISKSMNTSGYFRVHKSKCKTCKQGFR